MRFTLPRLFWLAVATLLIALAGVGLFSIYSYLRPLPQTEGFLILDGLRDPVTIYRDAWGVPHIYATNSHDLFMAQGYVHAQDRWWQMEVARHVGRGRLRELAGVDAPSASADAFIAGLGWERRAQRAWLAADAETRAALSAYADGVNAYIRQREPADLAVQYSVLGLTEGSARLRPWSGVDSLAWLDALLWSFDPTASALFEVPFLGAQTPQAQIVPSERTAGGLPLLLVSFQGRPLIPTPPYEVGLHCVNLIPACPYNMVGLSYAGLPALWTGHHDGLAWALAVRPSQFRLESVYLHPSDPRRYFDGTRWRRWRLLATHPLVRQAEGGFLWATVPFSPYGLRLTWSAADDRTEQIMSAFLRLNQASDGAAFAQIMAESPRLAGVYVAQTGESGWLGMEETTLVRVFRPQGLHSAQTVGTLMDDSLSPFAKTLLPYLTFRFSADLPLHQAKRLRAYQNWLSAWTGDMAADSAQAQFFARWCATLTQALPSSLSLRDILPILSEPYRREWDDPRTPTRENRDTLLLATWQSLIEDLPDEPRQDWRWDALHTATFISPVLGKNSALDALLNRRVGLGGSWDSLYRTAWTGRGETPFAVTDIPLFRVVYDPADWDNSQSILATGQSGHPASPHYDDMLDMWRSIAFRKMGWSPQAIREASANTLRLNPPD